jgi:Raf kinase inhibitor-like YbhB/YbcL family protein
VAGAVGLAGLIAIGFQPGAAQAAEPKREEGDVHVDASGFTLSSPSFQAQGNIPADNTCEGRDLSPALNWSGVPAGTQSLALIVDDPDAPDPAHPQRTFVHWVLYNLPATATGLPEGAQSLPPGTRMGTNDFRKAGWRGPCPPVGKHRYVFKLYALDTRLPEQGDVHKGDLEHAMQGHILARAELIGRFQKSGR